MGDEKKVYIVIFSPTIGGAEKRFVGLWIYFQEMGYGNIKLVVPLPLFLKIQETDEFRDINKYRQNLIILRGKTRIWNLTYRVWRIGRSQDDKCVFHYIGKLPPIIHWFLPHRTCLTLPSTSIGRDQKKVREIALIYLSIRQANVIDVLDPDVYEYVRKLKWRSAPVFNTPGSYIKPEYYQSEKYENKRNWVVFLGRFPANDEKNVIKFVQSIPIMSDVLNKAGISDYHIFMLGHGEMENQVRDMLSDKIYRGIPIKFYFEKNPQDILKYSKVFFSLQKKTNYPSKSLIEALACGNLPVVTDVGTTRRIVNEEFGFFVDSNFTSEDLAHKTAEILLLDKEGFARRTHKAREFVENNFSIKKNADYFLQLYKLAEK
jgi:glycosyltransferase involved in cell wall biosynthesis